MACKEPFQLLLFPIDKRPPVRAATSSTFVNNMALPIHRWYRGSAGFSTFAFEKNTRS
jgi:hypothetical protein